MQVYRTTLSAFTLKGLTQACARQLGLPPEQVKEIALSLFHDKAITYPLTLEHQLRRGMHASSYVIFDKLSEWSSDLESLVKSVDPAFASPVWVDDTVYLDHGGIIPLASFSPENFSDDQVDVFGIIAERYIRLYDPKNAGSDFQLSGEDRRFSRSSTFSISSKLLGQNIDVFGPSFYVDHEFFYISVSDGLSNFSYKAWLVVPLSLVDDFRAQLKFLSVRELLEENPKILDRFVEKANDLVLSGGRGLWKFADGIFVKKGKERFYQWPSDHLPL